jgi:hypothetical protein
MDYKGGILPAFSSSSDTSLGLKSSKMKNSNIKKLASHILRISYPTLLTIGAKTETLYNNNNADHLSYVKSCPATRHAGANGERS